MSVKDSWMQRMCEHTFFRAFMRTVRVAVPTGFLTLVGILLKDQTILQNYAWVIPVLVAVEKYLRDRRSSEREVG